MKLLIVLLYRTTKKKGMFEINIFALFYFQLETKPNKELNWRKKRIVNKLWLCFVYLETTLLSPSIGHFSIIVFYFGFAEVF